MSPTLIVRHESPREHHFLVAVQRDVDAIVSGHQLKRLVGGTASFQHHTGGVVHRNEVPAFRGTGLC